jgi:hypothetical protein
VILQALSPDVPNKASITSEVGANAAAGTAKYPRSRRREEPSGIATAMGPIVVVSGRMISPARRI